MFKIDLIKPENYCVVPVFENMKRGLKPDECIKWVNLGSGTVPITLKKHPVRLSLERTLKKVSQLGLRYKIRKRIK